MVAVWLWVRASLRLPRAPAVAVALLIFFFFSSRRRHTRCLSDWSSDVCSSDLLPRARLPAEGAGALEVVEGIEGLGDRRPRSEERRVGKECRSRWAADHEKKKRKNNERQNGRLEENNDRQRERITRQERD